MAELVLQFDRGLTATVHMDFVRRPPSRSLQLIGERGVLRWEFQANRVLVWAPENGQWRVEEGDPKFQRNDMYLSELRHFVSCVRGEVPKPLIDIEQGAAILVLALAALRSSAEGCAIDVREFQDPLNAWLSSLGRP